MVADDEALPSIWSEVGHSGFLHVERDSVGHSDIGGLEEFDCFFLLILFQSYRIFYINSVVLPIEK